ncbi:hypothetical protein V5N34_05070 [Streptomyces baarnensis]|nr:MULTISPECIES: hypothetical protein [unclassified Streptomyces]MDX5574360.1 hypothetical protein [Streptomyces sp. ID01-9D]
MSPGRYPLWPGCATGLPFEALESDAVFDRVLYDGAEFGIQAHLGSEEEQDCLRVPGLLEPDQVQLLLLPDTALPRVIAHLRYVTNGKMSERPDQAGPTAGPAHCVASSALRHRKPQ